MLFNVVQIILVIELSALYTGDKELLMHKLCTESKYFKFSVFICNSDGNV